MTVPFMAVTQMAQPGQNDSRPVFGELTNLCASAPGSLPDERIKDGQPMQQSKASRYHQAKPCRYHQAQQRNQDTRQLRPSARATCYPEAVPVSRAEVWEVW